MMSVWTVLPKSLSGARCLFLVKLNPTPRLLSILYSSILYFIFLFSCLFFPSHSKKPTPPPCPHPSVHIPPLFSILFFFFNNGCPEQLPHVHFEYFRNPEVTDRTNLQWVSQDLKLTFGLRGIRTCVLLEGKSIF